MENNNETVDDKKPEPEHRGMKAMPFILGNETFEKLGSFGTSSNLLVYLTTVFNMKAITATTVITVFVGTCNFATILGAFLCDTYFGRYNTLAFASICSVLGLLMIDLTAVFKKLHPPHCAVNQQECQGPTPFQMAFLLMGLGLLITGAAGIRPCNFAFGADQFNPSTKSGKSGLTKYFNWYFCSYTFAQLVSLTLIVYVQSNVSWSIGLAIPAALMLLSCLLFFMGTKIYVRIDPDGSPFLGLIQVVVAAVRKRNLKLQDPPEAGSVLQFIQFIRAGSINSKLPRTSQFGFLDKAAIITRNDVFKADGSAKNPWRLSTQQQVEELICIVRVLPICASVIISHIPIVLVNTYVVLQALQSDRRLNSTNFTIPAPSYIIFLMISYTICILIYDRVLVPLLEKLYGKEGGITVLQRMGIGMVFSVGIMLSAGIVEYQRRTTALRKPTLGVFPKKGEVSSMSGFWLVFPLTLAGIAEAFTAIGLNVFLYEQFPENMKSVAGAVGGCTMALSSYLTTLMIAVVHQITKNGTSGDWLPEDLNKGRLDYFYYMVAVLESVNLIYFVACAKWYKYKETYRV